MFTLTSEQFLPLPLEEAWVFFSSPANLEKLTPNNMGFEVTQLPEGAAYPGMIISYKIRLMPGVKVNWVTEITNVKDQQYFTDEQRFGPYAMWHHEHHFKAVKGGVEMVDRVGYKLPLGALGRFFHFLIKPALVHIFDYRYKMLVQHFPHKTSNPN